MTPRVLRLIAFAIAVAGVIDPAIGVSGASRARVALVAQDAAGAVAVAVRDRLQRALSASFDLVPVLTSDAAAAIVIGDRFPDEPFPDALTAATVSLPAPPLAGTRIVRVTAPPEVPAGTAIRLDVVVDSARVSGRTTDVVVESGGIETGRASHRWTGNADRWHVGIDAVPIGDPPYVLRVRLPPSPDGFGGTTKPDTTGTTGTAGASVVSGFSRTSADVVVDVRRAPIRVQFYEPRPSWSTTFLRRALEADARFAVAGLSFASRGIAVQTGAEVPLGDSRLDTFDVVIVGGLDRLTSADARALDRFMRERGGAVVVVPDQRLDAGPARDLIFGPAEAGHYRTDVVERLLEQPAKLVVAAPAASLQASELLVDTSPPAGADVIARVPGDGAPVIVSIPRGDGRLLFSGAMDAWRFRAEDNAAFDRFWQSAIAGLAEAVPPPIAVDVVPLLLRPGERGEVVVRVRSSETAPVSASIDNETIRLVPAPEARVYRGQFVARSTPGRSTIEVRATTAASPAARVFLVRSDVLRADDAAAPSLSMLASSHHGIDVAPDRLADLERFIRGSVAAPRTTQTRHPMRSAWWILPFAVCLSAEWWIRRRKGLR